MMQGHTSESLDEGALETHVSLVSTTNLGRFDDKQTLERWELPTSECSFALAPLYEAANRLRSGCLPVAFPTETVYGLGADATRSDAVRGIYKAKGRPSDNPLIIHICDLRMLREIIAPLRNVHDSIWIDPIPEIYRPLIQRFWPGPLTILLSKPAASRIAPEVTAGLPKFGVRMPDSALALTLIHLTGRPLAAPSANESTRPSPTTAAHVLHDLKGKIELIVDGGPCRIGVESTVVDGLCDPPVVLRPGGVSIDAIRDCAGWSGLVKDYKDQSEVEAGAKVPRAPGMKYKHYSPKAKVILFETRTYAKEIPKPGIPAEISRYVGPNFISGEFSPPFGRIGIIRTRYWNAWAGLDDRKWKSEKTTKSGIFRVTKVQYGKMGDIFTIRQAELHQQDSDGSSFLSMGNHMSHVADLTEIALGEGSEEIAHGLFAALRELDDRGAQMIWVEGISDEGDIAAAVMNRLRKAATVIEKHY